MKSKPLSLPLSISISISISILLSFLSLPYHVLGLCPPHVSDHHSLFIASPMTTTTTTTTTTITTTTALLLQAGHGINPSTRLPPRRASLRCPSALSSSSTSSSSSPASFLDGDHHDPLALHDSSSFSTFSTTSSSTTTTTTSSSSSSSSSITTTTTSSSSSTAQCATAIVLNTNARSVTPELVSIASQIFGDEHVYVTSTFDDARSAVAEVVRKNYRLVVPVGGDGTLSGWIDGMVDEILRRGNETDIPTLEEAVAALPILGYIPMGTGNGLGYVIGATSTATASEDESATESAGAKRTKRGIVKRALSKLPSLLRRRKQRKLEDARRVMNRLNDAGNAILARGENLTETKCSIAELSLMEVTHHSKDTIAPSDGDLKGDLCFFAGVGFDSLMLHDFQRLKAWSSSSRHLPVLVKDALSSVAGYCVALVTKTLPQTIKYGTHNVHVIVTTPDEETLWIDHRRGDFAELAIPPNADDDSSATPSSRRKQHLLYRGTTGILSASTAPFYGGGMKLFPYASLYPRKLQLRLGRISPLTGFFNIPKIFEGSYREKSEGEFGCLDFIGDDFEVEVSSDRYDEYLEREKRVANTRRRWWTWFRAKETGDMNKETNNGSGNDSKQMKSGFPFQHSGESMGCKERFRLRVIKVPVKFISFLEPRVIIDE